MHYEVEVIVIAATTVSTWIVGFRMRRKIRRVLGRKATDTDLTSITTWMEVDEQEDKAPLNPK
ncbi:MAG: hypothetical protein ACYDBL_10880 [Candidatus Acidiferrales bacterium]